MNHALDIIKSIVKIQERSDTFRHGREEIFDGISLAEVHTIDWIGTLSQANVTKVANKMGMTRGAISKINRKLLNKALIQSYQLPENNKEIYYRLTERGQQVYNEHLTCHNKAKQDKLSVLEGYNDQEQLIILRFLNDINLLLDRAADQETPEEEDLPENK